MFKNEIKYLLLILLFPVSAKAFVCFQGIHARAVSVSSGYTINGTNRNTKPDSLEKFSLVSSSHKGVAADFKKPLQLIFNQPIDAATIKNLIITTGGAEGEPLGADSKTLSGKWVVSRDSTAITFIPTRKVRPGSFVSVTIPEAFKSRKGAIFKGGKDIVSFILDNGAKNGQRVITIDTLKIVDNNRIPLVISVPDNSEKHPVFIFVHGGGWSGGTPVLVISLIAGRIYGKLPL